jgi:hypothetical protein
VSVSASGNADAASPVCQDPGWSALSKGCARIALLRPSHATRRFPALRQWVDGAAAGRTSGLPAKSNQTNGLAHLFFNLNPL